MRPDVKPSVVVSEWFLREIADAVYAIGKKLGGDDGEELKRLATLIHCQFNNLPLPGEKL